jgi:hypothetical protein
MKQVEAHLMLGDYCEEPNDLVVSLNIICKIKGAI